MNHSVTAEVYASLIQRLVALRNEAKLTNAEVDAMLGKNGMAGHYFGSSQWSLPTEAAWSIIRRDGTPWGHCSPWSELRQEFDSRRQEFDSRRQEFDSRRREFDSRRRSLRLSYFRMCGALTRSLSPIAWGITPQKSPYRLCVTFCP